MVKLNRKDGKIYRQKNGEPVTTDFTDFTDEIASGGGRFCALVGCVTPRAPLRTFKMKSPAR